MNSTILKQHNIGNTIGGAIDLYSRASIFNSIVSNVMLASAFYGTGGKELLQQFLPWINFWIFLILLAVGYLLLMVLTYKFIVPCTISFQQWQSWEHKNPVRADLREIRNQLEEIRKELRKEQSE